MISWLIQIAVGCLLAPTAFGEPTPVNLLRQPGFKDCGENIYDCSFLARIFLSGIFSCPVFFCLAWNFILCLEMFYCLAFFFLSSFVCLISVRVFFSLSCVFLPWLYFFLSWNVFLPNIFFLYFLYLSGNFSQFCFVWFRYVYFFLVWCFFSLVLFFPFLACSLKLFVIPRENRRFTSKSVCLMVHGYTSVPR